MVLELVSKAIFSVADLLKGSFFIALIAFILVFLASFPHSWLSKKYNLSWLKATIITSYLTIFILIILLYSAPAISGISDSDQGIVPAEFQMSAIDWASFIAAIILRNAFVALLLAFFVLPLEFFGSMVFDYMKEKYHLNKWANVFAAVFAASLLAAIVGLFLLPWIVPGLLYLTFFWHL